MSEISWTSVIEELPEGDECEVLVTYVDICGRRQIGTWIGEPEHMLDHTEILAWASMPEPYVEETGE